ncbi:LPXTG cell wall anchor domain-containing protein [Ruoffia sp. FAM 20857]|uniref:LPXTG cell wall anchor domain-containing protein n=1 Tax=Ruoffia sp. FAM 20857 TaxID=3259515 RepID=UPI0038859FEF
MKINTKFNKKLLAILSLAALANVAPLAPNDGLASNLALVEAQASSETNASDIEAIKQSMIDATPITENQFAQISEDAWLAYVEQGNNQGGDPSAVYDWAIEDYPEVFEPEATNFRIAMVENYNLDEESLNTVSDRDLLWLEYQIWVAADGQEDLPALADALVEDFGVEYGQDDNERVEALKETMLASTPLTDEQFDAIPAQDWLGYADEVNEGGGDPSTVYNNAVEDYPEVFEETLNYICGTLVSDYNLNEESLNSVSDIDLLWLEYSVWVDAGNTEDFETLAQRLIDEHDVTQDDDEESPGDERLEAIKQSMIDATPLTDDQFEAIPATSWLEYSDRVNEGGGDPSTVYNWAVEDYPEVFEDTIAYIRGTLVSDYNLNEESLNSVSDIDLLWLEYSVWVEAGNTEDFETLAQRLIEEHDVIQDDEETPGETELERIRTVMIESTPITPDQFEAIPATTWISYTEQINEEGGDPSTAYNWALRDYPEVFEDTIAYIRGELINRYNLEEASLNERVSDQELLWEEYTVWLQNGEENLEALSQVLVQEYGVRTTSTQVPDEDEENTAPTLPNTGETRTSYSTYIMIAIVGLVGAALLLRDYFVNNKEA